MDKKILVALLVLGFVCLAAGEQDDKKAGEVEPAQPGAELIDPQVFVPTVGPARHPIPKGPKGPKGPLGPAHAPGSKKGGAKKEEQQQSADVAQQMRSKRDVGSEQRNHDHQEQAGKSNQDHSGHHHQKRQALDGEGDHAGREGYERHDGHDGRNGTSEQGEDEDNAQDEDEDVSENDGDGDDDGNGQSYRGHRFHKREVDQDSLDQEMKSPEESAPVLGGLFNFGRAN